MSGSRHQILISLPQAMACAFSDVFPERGEWFVASDPPTRKLGSGGGTAYLLANCWKKTGNGLTFREWLRNSRKLMVHGGGQSRRLPAYAAVGKPFIPVPVSRNSIGQSFRQYLIDLQLPDYQRLLSRSPDNIVAMVTSGDVLLKFGRNIPAMSRSDIIAMGMSVSPQQAEHFGVFFTPHRGSQEVEFFLQKPPSDKIKEFIPRHDFQVDTGIWLMSENAVMLLMEKCGWDDDTQAFKDEFPSTYELYSEFGLSLGSMPAKVDADIGTLSSQVVFLPSPEFYHMGTSRQLIESMTNLQNRESASGWVANMHPDQFIINTPDRVSNRTFANHTLWIENSDLDGSLHLSSQHVITGIPSKKWKLHLHTGQCMDFVPVGEDKWCVRFYGIDDNFTGSLLVNTTKWLGKPASRWFRKHKIIQHLVDVDIFNAKLFPILSLDEITDDYLAWLIDPDPVENDLFTTRYLEVERLSSDDIGSSVNIKRLFSQQMDFCCQALTKLYKNRETSIFPSLDLADAAQILCGRSNINPAENVDDIQNPLRSIHTEMFHAQYGRIQSLDNWCQYETDAFSTLCDAIITSTAMNLCNPRCCIQKDQIVWGRSPVRMDLAGGWTDTPPYCLEHGGKVVNLACNLNGQPPVQVFARINNRMEIVIRSIDLGVDQRITSYDKIRSYAQPGCEFALAKAALAVAGFLPEFNSYGSYESLQKQLSDFGGGIEISLLSAIPAGSGLGTSSILASTILSVLSELCGLGWDKHDIISRVLTVEQMLTTGGGWQDQVGGVFPGIKLSETTPGLPQKPSLRWLPDMMFTNKYAREVSLLYYTGVTRMAKNILQDIVRGMFLNSRKQLDILEEMRYHAIDTYESIQRNDCDMYCSCVAKSWDLNQALDSGTNPPQIQAIIDKIDDYLACAKLLGAGGGGYMYMIAKDENAAQKVRHILAKSPPNALSRFVDFTISNTGLEITKS
ncbi:MAG: bifunctional fucokinase/fucose-1-phosphate guanylyltransferase [Armatimonadota bacterium]